MRIPCSLLTSGCLPAAGETIHPWQVLDGVVRGRSVVVLGTASEPMPVQSMAELSPHIREADVLVTSPALQVSSLLLALLVSCCNLTSQISRKQQSGWQVPLPHAAQ